MILDQTVCTKPSFGPLRRFTLSAKNSPPAVETAGVKEHFLLDPEIVFLNHGSFGACPRPVLEHQRQLRERLEAEPVDFFLRRLPAELDAAREQVASFLGARPENLAFVRNATEGVNAVLSSLPFTPWDQVVVTSHGYNACNNAARYWAGRVGAQVVTAQVPFPLDDPEQVVESVVEAFTGRTRLLLVDHVTSPTGLVLPLERIVHEATRRGIEVLVDGAHGPGMIELDLERLGGLGVSYYTGNFHKWCCAPKGAAALWVRADRQKGLHPPVISHGYNSCAPRSKFLEEFDWTGTSDPTPWLCVPVVLDFFENLVGWPALRERNRELALEARVLLAEALGVEAPAPVSMIGSLAALPLPDGEGDLHQRLFDEHRIEVPVMPRRPRLIRVSAFLYNEVADYRKLAIALEKQGLTPTRRS